MVGALGVIRGLLSVGNLTVFLSYATQFAKPFNEISGVMTELSSAMASASRVFELLDTETLSSDSDKEELADVLKSLTTRGQKVLRLRFGLDDGQPRTLEEVGKVFNVTRERIRQIEAKAIRKLRHPTRSKKLRDFLE